MDKHRKKLKEGDHDTVYAMGLPSLKCVLPSEVIRPSVPLVDVFVGTVPEKKFISHYIINLNRFMPVTALNHLKRVKNNKIIICFTAEGTEDYIVSKLSELKLNLLSNNLEVVSVPKCAPKTRQQFMFSNEIWPTNFHEDRYLESLISNILFSEHELKQHEKWMRIATEAARRCVMQRGSVIVDPQKNEVIAVASDSRDSHPLRHSVMVAIDLVARSQGGGAWIPHPADFSHSASIQYSKLDSDTAPYLCTGYYLYATHEPCIMCAMALVHSRVKRVFYGSSSPNGALGTVLNIHFLKNLNHHYEVFAVCT